jgi:hypothetical protein
MNEHTIVTAIVAAVAVVAFAVRAFRKVVASPGLAPTAPERRTPPRAPSAAVAPRRAAVRAAAQAAAPPLVEAFSILDLTLPDAGGPAPPAPLAPLRRRGRSMLGTGVPGSAAWGAGAIVAMEILGPPVSLRSGATLGAPHAF